MRGTVSKPHWMKPRGFLTLVLCTESCSYHLTTSHTFTIAIGHLNLYIQLQENVLTVTNLTVTNYSWLSVIKKVLSQFRDVESLPSLTLMLMPICLENFTVQTVISLFLDLETAQWVTPGQSLTESPAELIWTCLNFSGQMERWLHLKCSFHLH